MRIVARWAGVILLTTLLLLPLTFSLSMTKGFNHDEHQHVAAGALLARESLLPYRDFPCFHTPHLVFVYGWLFESGGYLLVKARGFSAVCAALTAGVLFAGAWHALRRWNRLARWIGSLSALALLLSSPLFQKASGHAGNHDPATVCALAGVVLLLGAAEARRPMLTLVLSGLFLGLAAGFRITWAPIGLPMLCVIGSIWRADRRRVAGALLAFSAGALLGLAPLLWLFTIAPEQTIFSLFEFPQVNVVYRLATGHPPTMTLFKKVRYFWKEVVRPDFPLAAALGLCAFLWWRVRHEVADRRWLGGLALMVPFILIGSFAPSPLFYQYFYAPLPFVLLAAVFCVAGIWHETPRLRSPAAVLLACVAVAVARGVAEFPPARDLFACANWNAIERHERAQSLRAAAPAGRLLTLAPIHAVEAGFPIYPPFSTGPFAWRVAPFVAAQRRPRLGLVADSDLESYLRADPPVAILLGYEEEGEEPLAAYATAHGYRPQPFGTKRARLWLRPEKPADQ